MTDIEKRGGSLGVETRAADGKRTLVGYAAVWNSETTIDGAFREKFLKGAFAEAIRGDIWALFSHDIGRVIGRTKSGTLRLAEDDHGLRVEIDVPDTSDGRDLLELVNRGDISGMSFAFRAIEEDWDFSGNMPSRTVAKSNLYEVTATASPAYPDTSIGVRSLEAARDEARKAEDDRAKKAADAAAAARRIAEKRAAMEQRVRGIKQDAS